MWSKFELVEKQARFWVLMARGSTLTAACDAVGVNRRTGRRWRQATGGRIPLPEAEKSGRYLCLEERLRIADLHINGAGVRAIAVEVGRSPATISRELARGGSKAGPRARTRYAPYAAHKQAELRGRRPKASKFDRQELASLFSSRELSTVLMAAAQVAGHTGELISADDDWLTAHNVNYWAGPRSLPLWLPRSDAVFAQRSRSRFLDAGGTERNLMQTLQDVLADERARGLDRERRSGLARGEESLLLDEFRG